MSNVPALLLVFSDPGDQVTETEFHDWYDNEHVPLRVDIPAFTSWRRLKAANPQAAPWAALYDLTCHEDTQKAPYTTLAETRSEREKDVLSKLKLLDRRIYELWQGTPVHPPSPSFDEKKPPQFVSFVFSDIDPELEEEYNKWYDEEHIPLLSKVPGWLRTRRFVLKEWNRVGTGIQEEDKPPTKYVSMMEWDHFEGMQSEEYKHATSTPWRMKIVGEMKNVERPVFTHYKVWHRE
ncbi:hypothetical protein QCA50_002142 [Cerrena zonata]|uniref:EthD domain-containing protein n=1 Tax=Cerrena zonata TaxID=2478898 RepID=A0AAW0GUX9_9APHY